MTLTKRVGGPVSQFEAEDINRPIIEPIPLDTIEPEQWERLKRCAARYLEQYIFGKEYEVDDAEAEFVREAIVAVYGNAIMDWINDVDDIREEIFTYIRYEWYQRKHAKQ